MKLKYRRIYAFTVILLFVILTPLLILYTAGYRYDLSQKKIIRTGVLTIDSQPRGATIILNGKTLKKKTQTVIKNLKPQEHQVEIKKEGYYSWQKKLAVLPNQATFTNRVALFKKNSPSLFLPDDVSYWQISPNKSFLAYLVPLAPNNFSLVLKRPSNGEEINRFSLREISGVTFTFSLNDNYLFVSQKKSDKNNYQIIFLGEQSEPLNLEDISPLDFTSIKESPTFKKQIYGLSNGSLYVIDLEKKTARLLFKDEVEDFLLTENNLYYISRKSSSVLLKKAGINGESSLELLTLNVNSQYSIEKNSNGILALLDEKNHRLSLVEPTRETSLKLKQLDPRVSGFQWSPDQKKLLFFNDFELWVLNLETEEQELLIRSSEEIQSVQWYPDMSWILFQQANKIKAIELDGRGKRNIIELAESREPGFFVDPKENRLFFIGQPENLQGLYTLDLD